LAQTILSMPGAIRLATGHVSRMNDSATALRNIEDVAKGLQAQRSHYGTAPGGTTSLSRSMLLAIVSVGQSDKVAVSEIAGGSHAVHSTHYAGRAVDFSSFDGQQVGPRSNFNGLVTLCRKFGASAIYDPANDPKVHRNHVHCEWAS
jgi:hypothetical protein